MGALDEPFPGSWARQAGLVSQWELRHNFVRLFPDVYLRKGCALDAVTRARAAGHWAKGSGVLVGYSAAALHGTNWLDPEQLPEIARPGHCKAPAGIRVVQAEIDPVECCAVAGFRVTTPARTGFDLGCRLARDEAVPILDALCAATGLVASEIAAVARAHPGARGVHRLPAVLDVLDGGAESPPESRVRLLLMDDGLPRPTTQLVVRNGAGDFLARVDLGWEPWRVAVEYDGIQHWTDPAQRTKDIDRIANLESMGWRVVRVNATLLRHRPHVVLDRVRGALVAQGWTSDHQVMTAASVESAPPPLPGDHASRRNRGCERPGGRRGVVDLGRRVHRC